MSFNFSRDFQTQGSGGYHYSTVSAKDVSSIKGGELVIPSQDNNGGRVERIKENGFSGCSNINSVIVPDTVRMIGKPDYDDGTGYLSLTTYFSLSFSCCNNLISVSVPDTLSFIGAQAFDGCVHLKSFIVRDTGADKLTLSRWRLDADDMYGCTLYVAERHLANAKKNFDKIFYKIDKLENAPTWQSLLSELDRPMPSQGLKFESSGKSTEGYNSHTYVYGRVGKASNFDNGLKNLVIPEIGDNKLIRQIDSSGFFSTNIKTVYLPNSLEYIGTPDDNSCGYNDRYNAYSFKNCTQLSVINASDRLKHIGTGAFDNSFNIKHFIIRDTGMPKMSISNWRITKTVFNDCTLYVPSQHLSTVKPKLEKTFRNVTTLDQIPAEIIALFPNVKYEISKDAPKAEPKKETPKPQPAPAPKAAPKAEPKAEPKKETPKPQPAPAPKQEPKETEPKKETPKPQPAKKVEIKENTVNGKTTYSFNGEDGLSKSKLCLSIIRYYIEQNPDITVSQLREMFNIKNNNMVETIDGALKICDSSGKAGGNYSMKDADQIATKEGKVVVWNYWPERYFNPFMEIVETHVFASDKKETPKPQPAPAPKQEPKKETPKPQPAPAPKAEPKKEAPKPEVRRPSADDMNVLDKLIDAALEDFVLTDEERSVLLKKSKEIGLGEDEFKIYLNGKIQERMKDKPAEKVEEEKKGFFARLFGK